MKAPSDDLASFAGPERDPGEIRGRARASGRVAAGMFLTRISGLVREGVFAHHFGTSVVADVWRAALRTPNILQNLLGEGTLSASFIPIYSELLGERRDAEAARFAGAILGLLTATAGLLAVLGILAAPLFVAILFAGFDPDQQALTVELVRILFPMTALLVVSAWGLGVLNSHRRFFLPYVAPLGWNACMIGGMLVGSTVFGASGDRLAHWLAWSALLGGGVQLGVQLPLVLRLVGELRPSLSINVTGVREALRNFVPVVAARGALNVVSYLDYFLAAYLATGAVAVLGYAQTLYLLPISLFALSTAASELPELSRDRQGGTDRLKRDVGRGVERVTYFLAPSTVAYLLLGDVIVAALFQRGEFSPDAVRVTWAVLAAYSIGMSASAASRVLSSAFYAIRNTRTPARIAYLRVGLSTAVGLLLMLPMDRL
ncbi:MAG: murein biosynthesis integral membrane protein MurJ, partial [Gemmatimonadetes bacterium]|nr:murein biosynthesis integral membrane protein MurJ [Gemmatimonadota bacterium]